MDFCHELGPIVEIVKLIIKLFKYGIPALLVIFGMMDLGKAVMAGKEDEMKKAQGTLIKRAIYAVAVFLVVTIVSFLMKVVTSSGADTGTITGKDWAACFFQDDADDKDDKKNDDVECDEDDPDCDNQ